MSETKGVWVVLAWMDERPAVTGTRSGRWGPVQVVSAVPWSKAGVWCQDGGEKEIAAAWKHAETAQLGAKVYTYPAKEVDPLGRARADCMRDAGHKPPADALGVDGQPRS